MSNNESSSSTARFESGDGHEAWAVARFTYCASKIAMFTSLSTEIPASLSAIDEEARAGLLSRQRPGVFKDRGSGETDLGHGNVRKYAKNPQGSSPGPPLEALSELGQP